MAWGQPQSRSISPPDLLPKNVCVEAAFHVLWKVVSAPVGFSTRLSAIISRI
jgi:hypothetical protein